MATFCAPTTAWPQTTSLLSPFLALIPLALGCGGPPVITEQPQRQFEVLSPDANRTSSISLTAAVDLRQVQQEFDAAVPNIITSFSGERGGCFEERVFGVRISIGCRWNGEVTKRGPVSLSGANDALHLSIPAHAWVTGRNRSGPTVRQTVRADFTVTATARPVLDSEWNLDPGLGLDLRWDQRPTLNLFNLIPISVTGLVEPEVRDLLSAIEAELEDNVARLAVRTRAEEMWLAVQEPIRLSNVPEIWLTVIPQAVSFSGIQTQDNVLNLTMAMESRLTTTLGDEPADFTRDRTLPQLGRHSVEDSGSFSIALPVFIGYETLMREIETLLRLGEEWMPVQDSGILLTVNSVDVYPSSPDIVVELQFGANLPNRLFGTTGIVYLRGRPVVDNENKVVHIEDFDFTAATDSRILNLVNRIFSSSLKANVQDRLTFEFGTDYDALVAKANQGLNRDLGGGVLLGGELGFVEVGEVLMTEQYLYLGVVVEGDVGISYGL